MKKLAVVVGFDDRGSCYASYALDQPYELVIIGVADANALRRETEKNVIIFQIKKENIGLIEIMGLAVLPARLKEELRQIEQAILQGLPLDGQLEKHTP